MSDGTQLGWLTDIMNKSKQLPSVYALDPAVSFFGLCPVL